MYSLSFHDEGYAVESARQIAVRVKQEQTALKNAHNPQVIPLENLKTRLFLR